MARRGDRGAFEKEVLKHMDSLYSTALRLTRSEQAAHDLIQDTYVKALRFWEGFEAGTNSRAWMYKIMMNQFYTDYARKEHERELMDLRPFDPASSDKSNDADIPEIRDPETFLLDHIVDEDLKRALEELPVDYRSVVMLSDLEDMSYKEIADVLDIPSGTVMSRLFRGRKALKTRLFGLARERGIVGDGAACAGPVPETAEGIAGIAGKTVLKDAT
jgi:RNA polymerase sigma-70 factor (ECF subfamily)